MDILVGNGTDCKAVLQAVGNLVRSFRNCQSRCVLLDDNPLGDGELPSSSFPELQLRASPSGLE